LPWADGLFLIAEGSRTYIPCLVARKTGRGIREGFDDECRHFCRLFGMTGDGIDADDGPEKVPAKREPRRSKNMVEIWP